MTIHNPGKKEIRYSPLWLLSDKLSRDRATINVWARSLYALYPDINRIIHQHGLLIMNVYQLMEGSSDGANKFCKEQLEDLNFPVLIEAIVREYFMIGEVFLHLELNERESRWSNVYIQNPDYILVKKAVGDREQIFLRPDENLRRICFSNKSEDIEVCKSFPSDAVESIKKGENIFVNPHYFWHMSHKVSPYDIRGSSFLLPLFNMVIEPDYPEKRQIIREFLGDITSLEGRNAKDILFMKYLSIIEQLEYWLNDRVLAMICKVRNLDGDLPRVKFDRDKLSEFIV